MKLYKKINYILFIVFIAGNLYAQESLEQIVEYSKKIKSDDFRRYMSVLAHDSLEGRNTASKGYETAANYVVDNLKEIGVQSGGENNSYFQEVPFKKCMYKKNTLKVGFASGNETIPGSYGETFTTLIPSEYLSANEEQKLVFVGNGIINKERNINDYEGVDVKGKTVIIEGMKPKYLKDVNDPQMFNPLNLINTAIEQGATGVIIFVKLGILQKMVIKQMHQFLSEPLFVVDNMEKGNPMLSYDLKIGMIAHKDLVKSIFKASNKNLKKSIKNIHNGVHSSFELDAIINFEYEVEAEKAPCNNIVAVVPGTDPVLKDEYIVLSAHLDHVGIGKPIKNDSIYNGAWDNASGSAGILSLAKSFKESPVKPKRSILFVWFTGEEKGLLGSHYFTHNPTVPKSKLVANVNLDMMGGFFESKNLLPIGYGMSNMTEAVDFAAKTMRLEVNDTASFLERYFENSDHYSFIQQDIPGIFVWRGLDAKDPKINGAKIYKKYERKTLHSPFDDLSQDFTNKAFLTGLKVHFLTTAYLANEMETIEWNTDNKLYKKYVLKDKELTAEE